MDFRSGINCMRPEERAMREERKNTGRWCVWEEMCTVRGPGIAQLDASVRIRNILDCDYSIDLFLLNILGTRGEEGKCSWWQLQQAGGKLARGQSLGDSCLVFLQRECRALLQSALMCPNLRGQSKELAISRGGENEHAKMKPSEVNFDRRI